MFCIAATLLSLFNEYTGLLLKKQQKKTKQTNALLMVFVANAFHKVYKDSEGLAMGGLEYFFFTVAQKIQSCNISFRGDVGENTFSAESSRYNWQ